MSSILNVKSIATDWKQVAGSIKAVSLGLDLTLRDLQKKLKQDGHPWEVSMSPTSF